MTALTVIAYMLALVGLSFVLAYILDGWLELRDPLDVKEDEEPITLRTGSAPRK